MLFDSPVFAVVFAVQRDQARADFRFAEGGVKQLGLLVGDDRIGGSVDREYRGAAAMDVDRRRRQTVDIRNLISAAAEEVEESRPCEIGPFGARQVRWAGDVDDGLNPAGLVQISAVAF